MAPMVGFPGLMAGPLKLPDYRSVWPEHLRPRGEDTIEKETFDCWWSRNGAELAHLPSVLCEQWIHRHWTHSPFSFLPLQTLAWLKRSLGGEELLGSVYRVFAGELNPQFDYETFHRRGGADRHRTAVALDSGSWDYPMVLLSTPYGIVDVDTMHPAVRLVLVEGYQRHRYLNALHALGRPPAGTHKVIILSSTEVG